MALTLPCSACRVEHPDEAFARNWFLKRRRYRQYQCREATRQNRLTSRKDNVPSARRWPDKGETRMKRIAVLALALSAVMATSALARGVSPKIDVIPVRWADYTGTSNASAFTTAISFAYRDTAFFNGADAVDTTETIDIGRLIAPGGGLAAVGTAAVGGIRVFLESSNAAAVDSIYFAVDVSLDGIRWQQGSNGTDQAYTGADLSVQTDPLHSFVIPVDPDAHTGNNAWWLAPKIRIRLKSTDSASFRLASTKMRIALLRFDNE